MNCDPLARWYRWMEYAGMGRALERRRFEFLSETRTARRILILGEGDGRFLTRLLRGNARAVIDVVDNSGQMLSLARKRASDLLGEGAVASRVHFHAADALRWTLPDRADYDLIVTHFFLDCFSEEELAVLVRRLGASARPGCRWLVSEFNVPESGFPAWRARVWISVLYRLFGLTTGLRVRRLPAYGKLLKASGFALERRIAAEMGLLVSEWWAREGAFAFDAPPDAHLQSRTPKS